MLGELRGFVSSIGIGEFPVVSLKGPGVFISAMIAMHNPGDRDLSVVRLIIDGEKAVDMSLDQMGFLQEHNSFGVTRFFY